MFWYMWSDYSIFYSMIWLFYFKFQQFLGRESGVWSGQSLLDMRTESTVA